MYQRFFRSRFLLLLLLTGLVFCLVLWQSDVGSTDVSTNEDGVFALAAPSFISVASAADNNIQSVISDEAGISAYFKTDGPINLTNVKSAYRTIETETADYLLGSVPLDGYSEAQDVHVYIHKDGWILAYYMKDEPVAKILDWIDFSQTSVITTKLENTIIAITGLVGTSFDSATYYDFRYPNATHMMLIADGRSGYQATDTFDITLPSGFGFFSRSWSLAGDDQRINYQLNGETIATGPGFEAGYGDFTGSQLPPNQSNTISLYTGCCSSSNRVYGGLALIYQE
ncbi:MAG: hypothetical protein AAF702_50745 [Chloroflexota bacterium]